MTDIRISDDREALAQAVASYLDERIRFHIATRGECHVVLPGGTTPARILQLLSAQSIPWHKVHWYPGDERCLPSGHAERNDTMIRDNLSRAGGPDVAANLHVMLAEQGPELAAQLYTERVSSLLDRHQAFDIVMLGMGEDGHTASLFPGNAALEDDRLVVPVFNSPKPPDERVTLGLDVLKGGRERIVLATGAEKGPILQQAIDDGVLPVGRLQAQCCFVDKDLYSSMMQA